MNDDLLRYYERELLFIRQLAQEFGRQYPAVADRLLLERDRGNDPHVERLIQAFALLAGRIQHKIDDEFPELTEALLNVLYPHYLVPVPSMAIVQFEPDLGRVQMPEGFFIPRHSALHTAGVRYLPGKELRCRFRTGYPVTLWPVLVRNARLQPPPWPDLLSSDLSPPPGTKAVLRLELECPGEMGFAELALDRLRFYLRGENEGIVTLYELIFNHCRQVLFRPLDRDTSARPLRLEPGHCLNQVGFERDDGLLPYPKSSFLGYRLLTEFFAFPAKFLFLDLGGWKRVRQAGFRHRVEVLFFLDRTLPLVEQGVDKLTFQLGCTPVVNLFEQTAEPINLNQARFEYRVIPDVSHDIGLEVVSVESVASTDPATGLITEYQPFYSYRHAGRVAMPRAFWYTSRRPSLLKDDRGTDVHLNLVDLDYHPHLPASSAVLVKTICCNRDLPTRLQQSEEGLRFELEPVAPLAATRCLRKPTTTLRPPLRRGVHWRLLGHLNLNHLSLQDEKDGRLALQEILSLYDFSDPQAGEHQTAATRQLVEGILSVNSRRVVGRTGGPTASGFARGMEVAIEFDSQKYVGTGVFLFACVLERFLGLYVSINSFTQLVARTRQQEEPFKRWPPRAGEQWLL